MHWLYPLIFLFFSHKIIIISQNCWVKLDKITINNDLYILYSLSPTFFYPLHMETR